METRPQSYDMYYVTAFQKGAITANPRGADTAEIRLFYRAVTLILGQRLLHKTTNSKQFS